MSPHHVLVPFPSRRLLVLLVILALTWSTRIRAASDLLTSRPLPPPVALKPLPVGEVVRTGTTQRRRTLLPDGSVLYINQQTRVRLAAPRRLKLDSGEVFVEVQQQPGNPFVIQTPRREVKSQGTRFAVRVGEQGTGVVVAG